MGVVQSSWSRQNMHKTKRKSEMLLFLIHSLLFLGLQSYVLSWLRTLFPKQRKKTPPRTNNPWSWPVRTGTISSRWGYQPPVMILGSLDIRHHFPVTSSSASTNIHLEVWMIGKARCLLLTDFPESSRDNSPKERAAAPRVHWRQRLCRMISTARFFF